MMNKEIKFTNWTNWNYKYAQVKLSQVNFIYIAPFIPKADSMCFT